MRGGDLGFPKALRLNKRSSYLFMNRGARRYYTSHLVVMWIRKDQGLGRLGITITKRIAGAVGRNHFKRRVREAYRTSPQSLRQGLELVVAAKKGAHLLNGNSLKTELIQALTAIQAISDE